MTSQELKAQLLLKRPKYSTKHEELIKLFANKGSSKSDVSQFGPVYELFIYAFFIGFNLNKKTPLPDSKKDFLEIGKWSPRPIVGFILSSLFININIDFIEIEDYDDKKMKDLISEIIINLEEYAHTGFIYLKETFDNKQEEFVDPFIFANLLKEIADKQPC